MIFDQYSLEYVGNKISLRYRQIGLLALALILGIGLCGTDSDPHSLGGERSLIGAAVLFVAGLLFTAATLNLVALLFAKRRIANAAGDRV